MKVKEIARTPYKTQKIVQPFIKKILQQYACD